MNMSNYCSECKLLLFCYLKSCLEKKSTIFFISGGLPNGQKHMHVHMNQTFIC